MTELTVTMASPLALSNVYTYPKSLRESFWYTTSIPGGDDRISVGIPCDQLASRGLPPLGSAIKIWDDYDPTLPLWLGRLNKYSFHIENKVLKSIGLEGLGYYHTGEGDHCKKFLTDVVYGPANQGSSPLTSKVVTTDIKDAFSHACTQLMPDVQVLPAQLATSGINLVQDSQTFGGEGAVSVFNFLAALTSYLATPMVWEILPVAGVATLRFWTVDTSPTYYDDGRSNQDLTYDWDGIINRATVEWGNNQRWTEPTDSLNPIIYTAFGGIANIQDKYVAIQDEYKALTDVQALALGYLTKFNQLKANGSVEFKEDLRQGTSAYIPINRVRAGRIIRNELPTGFPYSDTDRYIVEARYEESQNQCSLKCSFGEVGDLYRELRRLVGYPNQTTWATIFGSYGKPVPQIERVPKLGSEYIEAPGATDARVSAVAPVAAISDDRADKTFGTNGGQLLPSILPDNFSELMLTIRTNDGSVIPVDAVNPVLIIPISKDYKLSLWRISSTIAGTLTVLVKKNNVTFATLSITAGTNGNGTMTETTLTTGDIVTVFVTANAGSHVNVGGLVSGNKHWPQFPVYPVPGP